MNDEVKATYNKIADHWKNKVWVQSVEYNARIVSFAQLNGNEIALDVGIGSGDLETHLQLADVTGVDLSIKMLGECKRSHPQLKVCAADAEALPFRDEHFDLVYCRNLLQHFNDPKKAFGEMYRVAKKGGKILAIESAVYENETFCVTPIVRVTEPNHPEFPSHENLRALFETAGVNNIEQHVEGLHKQWLNGWCTAKGASDQQKTEIIDICKSLPEWYKIKYNMTFDNSIPGISEIESTLTFSFIKGHK